jgi:hypothetical protein
MPRISNIHDAVIKDIHENICDTAVKIANNELANDTRVPKNFRGPAFRNGSPNNDGRLVLELTDEYTSATERTKRVYRKVAHQSLIKAISQHRDLFAGMILGEAKAGRNYFDQWPQAPTTLF